MNKKLKKSKGRKLSSTKWLSRHIKDEYVIKAKSYGYRSRAAFKLLQIEEKYKIIKQAKNYIIDLGSAPGSWLQVVSNLANNQNKIIGVDLKPIELYQEIITIEGDFSHEETISKINNIIQDDQIDLILSDMAPATCGVKNIDHLRIISLVRDALYFASNNLSQGGNLIAKIWHGSEEYELRRDLGKLFTKVSLYKPKASYQDSAEIFLICEELKEKC